MIYCFLALMVLEGLYWFYFKTYEETHEFENFDDEIYCVGYDIHAFGRKVETYRTPIKNRITIRENELVKDMAIARYCVTQEDFVVYKKDGRWLA